MEGYRDSLICVVFVQTLSACLRSLTGVNVVTGELRATVKRSGDPD